MPKQVMFEGVVQEFPDDFTDDDIKRALGGGPKQADNDRAMLALGVIPPGQNPMPDLVKGALKGAGKTILGAAQTFHKIPGVQQISDAAQKVMFGDVQPVDPMINGAREELAPTNTTQKIGEFAEQAGEYAIPGERFVQGLSKLGLKGLLGKMVGEGAAGAGLAQLHGNSPDAGGLMGAAIPLLGAAGGAAGEWIGDKAVPLARAAIKPTVTAMKQTSGASQTGIDFQAARLARFIINNKLTTAQKAEAVIKGAEADLKTLIQRAGDPITEGPKLAVQYMDQLEQEAMKSASPDAVQAIRAARDRILGHSSVGTDVVTTTPLPQTNTWPGAQTAGQTTVRGPRTDLTASETLDAARTTNKWENKKAFGELKGADQEATKNAERGLRDGFKQAVPGSEAVLRDQGQAIRSKEILDRMQHRTGNREILGLPTTVMAAGEIASGGSGLMTFATHWLRNNQLKAGIWADQLAHAIQQQDTKTVAGIMGRLIQAGVVDEFPQKP